MPRIEPGVGCSRSANTTSVPCRLFKDVQPDVETLFGVFKKRLDCFARFSLTWSLFDLETNDKKGSAGSSLAHSLSLLSFSFSLTLSPFSLSLSLSPFSLSLCLSLSLSLSHTHTHFHTFDIISFSL